MKKFDKSEMNEAFARVEGVLDEVHTTLFGAIDGAFVVIDSYLDKVKAEVAKHVEPEADIATQRPVQKEVSLNQKMQDLVAYRKANNRSYGLWSDYLDRGIEPQGFENISYLNHVWENIPDAYRSK